MLSYHMNGNNLAFNITVYYGISLAKIETAESSKLDFTECKGVR